MQVPNRKENKLAMSIVFLHIYVSVRRFSLYSNQPFPAGHAFSTPQGRISAPSSTAPTSHHQHQSSPQPTPHSTPDPSTPSTPAPAATPPDQIGIGHPRCLPLSITTTSRSREARSWTNTQEVSMRWRQGANSNVSGTSV